MIEKRIFLTFPQMQGLVSYLSVNQNQIVDERWRNDEIAEKASKILGYAVSAGNVYRAKSHCNFPKYIGRRQHSVATGSGAWAQRRAAVRLTAQAVVELGDVVVDLCRALGHPSEKYAKAMISLGALVACIGTSDK